MSMKIRIPNTWKDIDEFNRVQRNWSKWGLILWGVMLILIILVASLGTYALFNSYGFI